MLYVHCSFISLHLHQKWHKRRGHFPVIKIGFLYGNFQVPSIIISYLTNAYQLSLKTLWEEKSGIIFPHTYRACLSHVHIQWRHNLWVCQCSHCGLYESMAKINSTLFKEFHNSKTLRINISNTRKSVSSDIQTLRSGLKKLDAAQFILKNF